MKVPTTGASLQTAKQDKLTYAGKRLEKAPSIYLYVQNVTKNK